MWVVRRITSGRTTPPFSKKKNYLLRKLLVGIVKANKLSFLSMLVLLFHVVATMCAAAAADSSACTIASFPTNLQGKECMVGAGAWCAEIGRKHEGA